MSQIGKTLKEIECWPLEIPVPQKKEVPVPERVDPIPATTPEKKKERVPALV